MTDATVSSSSPALPTVVVDIKATVKAEVEKALAEAKAEEVKVATAIKTFVLAHYSKVVAAVTGFAVAHFGVIEAILKFL